MQLAIHTARRWLPLVGLLALAVAAGMALSPGPAEAVGGLTLQDRIILSGEPVQYATNACVNEPLGVPTPTVPEGRRLFIYDLTFENNVDTIKLAGRVPLKTYGLRATSAVLNTARQRAPIVLNAGEPIGLTYHLSNGDPRPWEGNCRLWIQQAYLL